MKKRVFSRPVSVILTPSIFAHIQEITDSMEISVSDYIRMCITEQLQKDQSEQSK